MGIVWDSEVAHAKAEGRKIDGVAINAPYNKQDNVSYAFGIMSKARNTGNAESFLKYLGTPKAQKIYQSYGFLTATSDELKIKAFSK